MGRAIRTAEGRLGVGGRARRAHLRVVRTSDAVVGVARCEVVLGGVPEARHRRHRPRPEQRIDELLAARARTSSICPSEVARSIAPDDWRDLMEPARRAARRMVARGEVEITQGGSVVDPSTAKGPIRIRRPR